MVFLYIYLAGVIAVLMLLIFVKWLRPIRDELLWSFEIPLLFSWITVIIIVIVLCKSWKETRNIMHNLPKED